MAQAPGLSASLGAYQQAYETALQRLDGSGFQQRLFEKDPSLWQGDQDAISNRLGWLTIAATMTAHTDELRAFGEDVRESGFTRVVLLGMGGSSLAPEVITETLGIAGGYPTLTLLDTTDPATIRAVEKTLDLERTLFIVSSKSGTTVETASLYRYFAHRVTASRSDDDAVLDNFVAITDPGTPLEKQARNAGFRYVFTNPPDVGGRFSALSYFGLAPASAIGIDAGRLLDSARSLDVRSAVELGAMLASLALAGRDKVTFFASPSLRGFGGWAEQLLAESTGKRGKGLIPVDLEPIGAPEAYGNDRVLVHLQLADEPGFDGQLRSLENARHPVINIKLADRFDLGDEFLRWEIATAAAGAILGINPFDEPNVAEAKERTTEVLRETFRAEHTPEPEPQTRTDDIAIHMSDAVKPFLEPAPAAAALGFLLGRRLAREGDYYAIMAYIPRTAEHDALLTRLRVALRDGTRLATSVGYGPRFLHSTGQLFKGGPDKGVFIQITADDLEDVPIPGEAWGFSRLKEAQASGDLQALESRGRRIVRVHLGRDASGALRRLVGELESALPAAARAAGS